MKLRYALIYAVTATVAWFVPITVTGHSVLSNTAVMAATITALFASLLVKFAAFARKEGWQKLTVLYVPIMLLAFLMGVALKDGDVFSSAQLGMATLIHVAFWLNSCDSRSYRRLLFTDLGLSAEMPNTARVIALLEGKGLSHESDAILQAIYGTEDCESPLDLSRIEQHFDLGQSWLFRGVPDELQKYCNMIGPKRIEKL